MKTKNEKAISMRIVAIMVISAFAVLLMAIPSVMGDPGTTYYVSTTGQEASVTCANPESVTAGTYWWTLINNGYSLSDGDTLTMKVDGGAEQTVTFNTAEFSDITKAKASEIAAVINSETTGLTAYVSPPGDQCSGEPNPKKVSIRSDNPSGSIQVTGGTANAADKLDFYTAVHSGNAGTSASPWRTIQYAVIMASSGDTIQVVAGTYYEAVNIVGKDHITVSGEDRDTTIIDGTGQHAIQSGRGSSLATYEICPSAPIFLQNSEYVTVQGFTIQKSEAWGVVYMNDADHCTITDNIVKRDCWMFSGSTDYTDHDLDARVHPGYGIYLFKNNEYNTISNNIVHGAPASETYGFEPLDHADRGIFGYKFNWNPVADQNDENEISNNEVYNFRVNIRVCRADNNVIRDNYIHHARDNSWGWNGAGIEIKSYGDSPTVNNRIYHNIIICSDVGGGNAYDDGTNTVWDDGTSKGNFWDDYTGVDADGDGIGDTVYGPIPTANTNDNYPIVLLGLMYTGVTIVPSSSDVVLEATLSDSTQTGISGVGINFYFDDGDVGSATTNTNGVASLNTGAKIAGVYEVRVSVGCLGLEDVGFVAVYDPSAGFVTGGGWINSPEGAYAANTELTGKAAFGFVSKYKKGQTTPTGNTEFQFKAGDLNFNSDSYEWLVIAGHKAMYKGTGTINGAGDYGFMLSAIDEKLTPSTDVDMFRIKIWDKTTGDIIYDNNMGNHLNDDLTTAIAGGQIVIHKAK